MEEIKSKVDELVKKIQADEDLKTKFKDDPVKAVGEVLGVDLPDDAMEKIVAGVKAKISLNALGGLFGKK